LEQPKQGKQAAFSHPMSVPSFLVLACPAAISQVLFPLTPATMSTPSCDALPCWVKITASHVEFQIQASTYLLTKARLGKRPPDLVASMMTLSPRVLVYLERYSAAPELTLGFATGRQATNAHAALTQLQTLVAAAPSPATQVSHRPAVGVAGVVQRQEERIRQESALASDAFQDLDQLKARAAEVTLVIDRCAAMLRKSGGTPDSDLQAFDDLLTSVGVIARPVAAAAAKGLTSGRLSSSSAFVKDLAGEIASFLRSHSNKSSHWTLTDVFAMYNRARAGAGLVSPGDVLQACRALKELGLGFELLEYTNGVKIVRAQQSRVDAAASRIVRALGWADALSAVRLARLLSVPLPVATEWLELEEAKGALCRDDDGMGNLAFYENRFQHFVGA
jgi:hypothetical protein